MKQRRSNLELLRRALFSRTVERLLDRFVLLNQNTDITTESR